MFHVEHDFAEESIARRGSPASQAACAAAAGAGDRCSLERASAYRRIGITTYRVFVVPGA